MCYRGQLLNHWLLRLYRNRHRKRPRECIQGHLQEVTVILTFLWLFLLITEENECVTHLSFNTLTLSGRDLGDVPGTGTPIHSRP